MKNKGIAKNSTMKKVDKNKYSPNKSVVSDLNKIKNKFHNEIIKVLDKYGFKEEQSLYENRIYALEAENKKLQKEISDLKEELKKALNQNLSHITNQQIQKQPETKGNDMKVGQLVRFYLKPLLQTNKVSTYEIQKFQEASYSKEIFDINYPLLSQERFDANGYSRYYVYPINILGKQFYICSEWYEKSYEKLKKWLESHNVTVDKK